ncbi:MAG: cytochrome c oxidase subunit II [Gemmataceae bacterium]
MLGEFQLFPDQASTLAPRVDALYLFIIGITVAICTVTAILLIYFAIRYRRRQPDEVPPVIHGTMKLELIWTGIPLAIVIGIFIWSCRLYFAFAVPPEDAIEIYVTGRQWMWKVQHPDGQREVVGYYSAEDPTAATAGSEMHVPAGQPVKLILTSEDVIHSFFVPDFRVKQDAVPGRYTSLWFQATKPGRHRLFCAEYCGTNHSRMAGWVVAQEPADFQQWLSSRADRSLALQGRQLFLKFQCISCHTAAGDAQAPVLEGVYLQKRNFADGSSTTADEPYLRESIMNPRAKVVQGYSPIMPPYQGRMSEEELMQLIAYLKSLKKGDVPPRNETSPPPAVSPTEPNKP